jgi:hypothetical protein
MPTYYSDDYGTWEGMEEGHPDREDNVRFYKQRARTAVRKKCEDCRQWVRIQPEYGCCNSCAERREREGGY